MANFEEDKRDDHTLIALAIAGTGAIATTALLTYLLKTEAGQERLEQMKKMGADTLQEARQGKQYPNLPTNPEEVKLQLKKLDTKERRLDNVVFWDNPIKGIVLCDLSVLTEPGESIFGRQSKLYHIQILPGTNIDCIGECEFAELNRQGQLRVHDQYVMFYYPKEGNDGFHFEERTVSQHQIDQIQGKIVYVKKERCFPAKVHVP